MTQKAYFLSEDALRRVKEVVNKARMTPRKGSQQRRQVPVLSSFGSPVVRLGKTAGVVSAGAIGTVNMYTNVPKDEQGTEAPNGRTEQACNRGGVIAAGLWVYVIEVGNGFDMLAAECNPS